MPEPGSPEWIERINMMTAEELKQPKALFYMSFADNGFLGAVVVEAHGPVTAMRKSHRLGINPGGQVLTIQVPDHVTVPKEAMNRLLTKEQVNQYLGLGETLGEFEQREGALDIPDPLT
jgi:hypothetical protein